MENKKTYFILLPLIALLLLSTGCASNRMSQKEPFRFRATGSAFLEEAGQLSKMAPLNGASFVEATGRGFPASNTTGNFQKKLTALKAARYGALAGLVEEINGMEVTRRASVQNMVFSGDEVSVTISGVIQGATPVKESYDSETGLAEICLRVALDNDGNLIQKHATRIAPDSIYKRKAEAEAAARITATAALREQVGRVYVMQNVKVKDLKFESQQAQLYVEGLLKNVHFSEVRWIEGHQCEVTATIEINPKQMIKIK